jgi:hypothetical protein
MALLESCGFAFAHIQAGAYHVGLAEGKEGISLLAKEPQVNWYAPPLTTPDKVVELEEFFISTDLLRLGHWWNILAQPALAALHDLISDDYLNRIEAHITPQETVTVEPAASLRQASMSQAEPLQIPAQPELDPVLTLSAGEAAQITTALGASLPSWYEWEIATRGLQGWLYPWGNELDCNQLGLEHQDYSIDEESVMGYYSYDQDVYFIHSFGPYIKMPSPFGLVGLARPGREWNCCEQGEPLPDETYILRSISDLGAMAFMIPGIRPNTWSAEGWHVTKRELAFSGPVLPCYAPGAVGMRKDGDGRWVGEKLYGEAGFRLVFRT